MWTCPHEHPDLMAIEDPAVLAAESSGSGFATTPSVSMRPSATSLPTTSTKAAATPSAKPGSPASQRLTPTGGSGTATTGADHDRHHLDSANRHRHDQFDNPPATPKIRTLSHPRLSRRVRYGSPSTGRRREGSPGNHVNHVNHVNHANPTP